MLRYSREEVDEKDYSDFSTLSPDDSPTYSSPAVSSWEDRGDDKGEDDDESEVIGKFPLVEDKAKSSEPLTLSSSPTVSPPEDRRVVIGLVAEYQHYDIESEETMKFPLVGDKARSSQPLAPILISSAARREYFSALMLVRIFFTRQVYSLYSLFQVSHPGCSQCTCIRVYLLPVDFISCLPEFSFGVSFGISDSH